MIGGAPRDPQRLPAARADVDILGPQSQYLADPGTGAEHADEQGQDPVPALHRRAREQALDLRRRERLLFRVCAAVSRRRP